MVVNEMDIDPNYYHNSISIYKITLSFLKFYAQSKLLTTGHLVESKPSWKGGMHDFLLKHERGHALH